jgi:hypothetical protein
MEHLELDQISSDEAAVLRAIAREGRLLTLIKELAYGDVESLHFPATVVSRGDGGAEDVPLSDDDVLKVLHSLERRGLVTGSLTVHRVSTTEYICEWTVAQFDDIRAARGDGAKPSQSDTGSNDDILRAS